ncbi:type II toxin-antitoxin system HicA family toxin [Allobaculum sp. JKK-2023]|uniref:type II toxin-antitoxin system HicA family toxin n=1 Tax=Allobaculum sp. JKK-2023 TaxID=3108943 RepID=UPI002B0536E5|nr:type II toxin-antitoxin system HicA family toxin [Allobaculum sp. JKK-2023]
MRFREIEKIVLADGWRWCRTCGSYSIYPHAKKSSVTIPYHKGDLSPKSINSIFKQAELK